MRLKKLPLVAFLTMMLISFTQGKQEDEHATIRGRVTTLLGYPVPEAEIEFYKLTNTQQGIVSPKGELVQTTRTNNEGLYKVSGLPAGQYRIVYAGNEDRFYVWKGADRVLDWGVPQPIIDGLPQLEVSGIVRSINKKPLPDATVTLISAFNHQQVWQARTDKVGRYDIHMIQPGQYILYASKPEYAINVTSFLLNAKNKSSGEPISGQHKIADLSLSPLR